MTDPVVLWRDVSAGTEINMTSGAPQASGWTVQVSAAGTNWGAPEVRTSLLRALLSDGDLVQWDSNGNRVIPLQARITAPNSKVLAQAEATLDKMLYRRTELEWTPPDGSGNAVPTVWDVETSERAQVYDADWDFMENQFTRLLAFEMTCLPSGRSKFKRVATAPATAPSPVVLTDGSATTGFVGNPASLSVVSGRVRVTRGTPGEVSLAYTPAVGAAARYAVIDWYAPNSRFASFAVNGVFMADTLRETIAGGVQRSWVPLPGSAATLTKAQVAVDLPGSSGGYLEVDQIRTAAGLPTFGTARQKALGLATPGSVRTQTDLEVVSATTGLGFVLLHTGPATGGPPPMRMWLTSTAGTANTALISGAYNDLSTGANVYRIPIDLVPRGEVEIVASLYTNIIASNVTVKCDVQGYLGGAVVGPVQSRLMTTNYPVAQNPYLLSLGRFQFPPTRMGAAGFVQVTISQVSAGHIVYLDEAWDLSVGRGSALTVVEAGTQRRLRVEAPSQTNPQGFVTVGTNADGSDARFPGVDFIRAWMDHQILPEGTAAFLATTGATDATLTTGSYDRYHTHSATTGLEVV